MEGNAVPRTTESLLILIVDDDIPIGEMLAEVVRELGYTPLVAYNGQQALTLAREHWPALVITDQMMPFLSGTDLRIWDPQLTCWSPSLRDGGVASDQYAPGVATIHRIRGSPN